MKIPVLLFLVVFLFPWYFFVALDFLGFSKCFLLILQDFKGSQGRKSLMFSRFFLGFSKRPRKRRTGILELMKLPLPIPIPIPLRGNCCGDCPGTPLITPSFAGSFPSSLHHRTCVKLALFFLGCFFPDNAVKAVMGI